MKKLIPFHGASLLLLFLIATSCNKGDASHDEATHHHDEAAHHDEKPEAPQVLEISTKQFKAAEMELGYVRETSLTETISASGTLDVPPQNYAEVSAYIGGIIKSITVIEGDHVKKSETVMTLEHPDFIKLQEDYINAKSTLGFLEKEYERQKELYDEQVSSGKVFQDAEAKYNAEKGRLASIESQLSMLGTSTAELMKGNLSKVINLRSPISGYIGHVRGSIGAYAEPNKMLFDVIDNTHIHVHLDVYEKDFYKIKTGQKISVILPNQNNAEIEGEIFNIGKAMDNTTKSIAVHAEITNNKSLELIPGIFVNAVIHVSGHTAKAIPTEAVVRAGRKQYVFIVTDTENKKLTVEEGSAQPRILQKADIRMADISKVIARAYKLIEVETGATGMGLIEIFPETEITNDDIIVVKGAYFLISQLKSGETVGCCAPGEGEGTKK